MRAALWISLGIVFYAYIGYPLVMWAFARWLKRRSDVAEISPSVSIVLAVRNGMAFLPSKMTHLFNLDYPNIQEIIVVSDGSTDGSAEFLAGLSDPRLKSVPLKDHCGKAVALNAGMKEATAEVLLFVDIRPRIAPGAIQSLVSRFADPKVGCVAGELVLVQDRQNPVAGAVGGLYWRYEQWIRKCEASYDSPVGVYGGFNPSRSFARATARFWSPGLMSTTNGRRRQAPSFIARCARWQATSSSCSLRHGCSPRRIASSSSWFRTRFCVSSFPIYSSPRFSPPCCLPEVRISMQSSRVFSCLCFRSRSSACASEFP